MGNYWTSTENPTEESAEARLRALESRIQDLEGRLDTPYSRPPTPRPSRRMAARPSFPSWHGELMQKLNDRRGKIEDL